MAVTPALDERLACQVPLDVALLEQRGEPS
jgi:hypothetical protein